MKRPALAIALLVSTFSFALPAFAQTGPNTWSEPPGIPVTVGVGGSIVASDTNTLWVMPGGYTTTFYRYTISTKVWTLMAPVPTVAYYGGFLTFMTGTNYIYATPGNATTSFYRYNILTDTWTTNPTIAALPVGVTAYYGSSLTSTASKVYFLRGYGSTMFYEFDPAAAGGVGAWTVKAVAPAIVSYGGIVSWPGTGTTLFATQGNNTATFWSYDITLNTWSAKASVPGLMYYGGALAPGLDEGGSKILLAFRGSGSTNFYKYNVNLNSWSTLAVTPSAVSYGSGIVYPGAGTTIFMMPGNYTSEFWQYDQPTNTFVQVLNPCPAIVGVGGQMAGVNDGKTIYAVHGNSSAAFSKVDTSSAMGTWTSLAPVPVTVSYGGTLVWGGGDYLYCSPGNYTTAFYRYQISTNTWIGAAGGINQCPDLVYYGAAAAWGGGDYIYFARGYYTATFWRYSITNNLWEVMTAAPGVFGYGGSLTWAGGNKIYALGGGYTTSHWSYSTTGDSWLTENACPIIVYYGASTCYPGSGNYIFIFPGYSTAFYTFDITTNGWVAKASAPSQESWGTSLGYPGSGKYLWALKGSSTTKVWRYWIDSLAPLAPTGAAQRNLTDTANIGQGATITEPGLKFKATCTDQDNNQVKLQIELVLNGASFTSPATYVGSDNITFFESAFNPSGALIVITKLGLATGTSWKWQYRTVDMTEKTSAWTPFGPTDPDFLISAPGGTVPGVPNLGPTASLGQFKQNGTTAIAVGATTNQTSYLMKGSAVSVQSWQLETQTAKVGAGYTTSVFGDFVAGGGTSTATFVFAPPPASDGNYEWRARAINSYGQFSAWVNFNNTSGATDFNVLINVPPSAPTNLDQLRTLTMISVPVAGGSYEGNVTFRGTVVDPNVPDTVQLQIEVKLVGTSFDGITGVYTSALVPNGTVVNIPVTGLTALASYHWRARCIDDNGTTGPWQPFGSNLESQADFTVTQPPNPPTTGPAAGDLKQFMYNATTPIAVGGTTAESVFVVTGAVTTAQPGALTLKLQVEARLTTVQFTQVISAESLAVNNGQIATVYLPVLPNGNYQWHARTLDVNSGIVSVWVDYGGNVSNPPQNPADIDIVIAAAANSPPNAPLLSGPGSLQQFWYDGTTLIPVGGNTPDTGILVKATISDPNSNTTLRLEVECRLVDPDQPFTGTDPAFMFYSPYVLTGSPTSALVNIGAGASGAWYHWRARTKDSAGAVSAWVYFGGNTEADADFVTQTNSAPFDPFNLNQGDLADTAAIVEGGTCDEPGIKLIATAFDPDGDQVQIEFEVKPTATAFNGSGTIVSALGPGFVPIPQDILPLIDNTDYHWRARARDSKGKYSVNWVEFGVNPDPATDFHVDFPSTNTAPNPPLVASLDQTKLLGTDIATGATTDEAAVRLWGTGSDPDTGTSVRIEFELRDINTAFNGTATHVSPFVSSGVSKDATASGLNNIGYHWRARTADAWGLTSAWVAYDGTNSDGAPPGTPADSDFIVLAPNNPPDIIIDDAVYFDQFRLDSITVIPAGIGTPSPQSGVIMKAIVVDPDAGNSVRIQVECKIVGSAWDGTTNLYNGNMVPSGNVSTVTVTPLTNNPATNYMWRARAVDQGGATSTAWTNYATASTSEVDFRLVPNTPPSAPSGINQYKQIGDVLPVGAVSDITGAVFKATLNDLDGANGDKIRLQVEVQPIGQAFANTFTVESPPVNPGTLATVTALGLANGNYHWQYRAIDSNNEASSWTSFGGNSDGSPPGTPADVDFSVLNNAPPNQPTSLNQLKLDGITALPEGSVTNETGFKISALVSDPDGDQCKLQVEVKPIGTPYDGTGLVESGLVANNSVAVATFTGSNGQYRWQCRTMDQWGIASPWVAFGTNDPNTGVDVEIFGNSPPGDPTALAQFKSNGSTAIALGAATDESSVVLKATVTDSDSGDSIAIEAEVKLVGVAFDGTGTVTGTGVASGATAQVTVTGLTNAAYHWRVRAVDAASATSSWISYPTPVPNTENPPTNPAATDFSVNLGSPPTLSGSQTQHDTSGGASQSAGFFDDDQTMVFKSTVNDSDGGATISVQVEVKLVSVAFDGTGLVTGTAVGTGLLAEVTVNGLADGSYHWRIRAIDNTGLTSAWVNGLGNTENPPTNPAATDFTIDFVNDPPLNPTSATQSDDIASAPQTAGYVDNDATVYVHGVVTDPNSGIGQQVRLQVEWKLITQPFDGTTNLVNGTLVNSGGTSDVTIPGLADGQYHWRCRAVDAIGLVSSSWWAFDGVNSDGAPPGTPADVDFTVDAVNDNPDDITSAIQSNTTFGTSQPVGYVNTGSTTMFFRAVVTDPNGPTLGQQVQVEVEVKDTLTNFNGAGTVLGTLVASGGTSEATVNLGSDNTYHWRIRSRDAAGAVGAWFYFGGGNPDPGGIDFVINFTNVAPTVTGGINQYKLDATTVIAAGADTLETGVVLKATVADTDFGDTITVEVEVKAVGTPLTGVPNYAGVLTVLTGGTAQVTVQPLAVNNYHWGIRAKDAAGATSAWSYFGTNDSAVKDFGISLGTAPTITNGPTQHDEPASPLSPPGMISTNTSVTFKATATDPDGGQTWKLQVEIKPIGTVFSDVFTAESASVASGVEAVITTTVATDGAYHWQYRVIDSNNLATTWTSFGGNPDPNGIDFYIDAVNSPPSNPSGAQQYKQDGTTVIGAGAWTTENGVVFKATLTDPDPSGTITLQVEYATAGTGFASPTMVSSTPVSSGQVATATATIAVDGNYEWRYRATDGTNTTGWTEFVVGGATDFIIDFTNSPPSTPTGAQQYKQDGTTVIGIGAYTTENVVVFKATMTDGDPSNTITLQVEYATAGTGFASPTMVSSTPVTTGQVATATAVIGTDGNYEWRYRATDGTNTTGWTEFVVGGATDFIIDFTNSPPSTPSSPSQNKLDGTTVIATGAWTTENGVIFKATMTDPDPSNTITLQVEYAAAGTSFAAPTMVSSTPVTTGQVASASATIAADGNYEWRYRATDGTNTTAWTEFVLGGATDFIIDFTNSPPSTPSGAQQYKLDGLTVIAIGATTNENGVIFKATMTDGDPSNTITLQVEYAAAGTGFAAPTMVSSSAVTTGQVASATASSLANGDYEWRYRATDGTNTTGWTEFVGGGAADFTVFVVGVPPTIGAAPAPNQFDEAADASPVAEAFIDVDSTFAFKAVVNDADGGQTIKLRIEIKPQGTSFDGTTNITESASVTTGTLAVVTVTGLADGPYHWQYQAIDSNGVTSPWVEWAANATPDFTIDFVNNPPTISGAQQYKTDGTTIIAVGAITNESTVVFKATMVDGDPSNMITFTVERAAAGTGFAAPTQLSSAPVTPGSIATVTMTAIPDGDYEWRYRASDGTNTTAWTEFVVGGAIDFTVDAVSNPPAISAGPTQHLNTGSPSVPAGFVNTVDGNMTFKATVTDSDPGATAAIQVEIVANGGSFTNTPTAAGNMVTTGNVSEVTVNMPAGNYMWQARAIDNTGATSPWTIFDAAPGVDYTINGAPALPSVVGQFMLDTTTAIVAGGTTTESGVVFKATVSDPQGHQVKLEVELQLNSGSFAGANNTPVAPLVNSGSDSIITVNGLADNSYKWRYRVVDQYGAATAWTDFPPGDPDFIVNAPANAAPTDPSAASLSQHKADTVTIIGPGGTTNETTVVFKSPVSDPDGDQCKLEVEIQLVGVAFSGTPTASTSPLVPNGGTAMATVTGLVSVNSYHWQARVVDSNGAASNWVSFGTNPDNIAEVDFVVDTSSNIAPNDPGSLGQFKLDTTTAIAVGASTNENGVVFKAVITDPDANLVRLNIEVQPNGTPFTNVATAQSGFMATGSTAVVTVNGLADGAYHWQAWVDDSAGGISGYVANGGNPDFIIDVTNVAPNVPTVDGQFRLDGVTVIPDGGTTNETGVILRGTVSDPDFSQVALQVEIVPTGSGFSGTPTATSPMVANNGVASITINGLSTLVSYKWRFRSIDPMGLTSAWTDHGAGDPDFTVDTNNAPAIPAGLGQRKLDGITVIPNGGVTNEAGFTMWATLTDPDGDMVRLQAEVLLTGVPFTGTPTATGSPVASGSIGMVTVNGLTPGAAYHWQVRTIDAGGKTSTWVDFGIDPAFTVAVNVLPNIPSPTQNNPTSGAAVAVGTRIYDASSMSFEAMISDAGGEAVSFEIEVQPVGTAFTNVATQTSGLMASGSLARITVGLPDGSYHWQFRVVDASAGATAWASFGANLETEADFILQLMGGSRGAKCVGSAGAAGSRFGWFFFLVILGVLFIRRR